MINRLYRFCTLKSTSEFIKFSTQFLNVNYSNLNEDLDVQFQDQIDIHLSEGVLNINVSEGKTIVINRQTPNKQIWYSSPISGPQRFNYIDGKWINQYNKQLDQQLKFEIQQLLNVK